ncbi:MAG TPA: hypothetical protein VGV18_03950 [Verrucomicrobiae bacterium]|nr:hypothetical protein [Verrucomicrobiae bacterium]
MASSDRPWKNGLYLSPGLSTNIRGTSVESFPFHQIPWELAEWKRSQRPDMIETIPLVP